MEASSSSISIGNRSLETGRQDDGLDLVRPTLRRPPWQEVVQTLSALARDAESGSESRDLSMAIPWSVTVAFSTKRVRVKAGGSHERGELNLDARKRAECQDR
jgi:hypothetical protein